MKLPYSHIFFLGIKGVAMANLAIICQQAGISVSGCDVSEEFITDASLKQNHINVLPMSGLSDIPVGVDAICFSSGHGGSSHPLVIKAKEKGIACISQPELLSKIMDQYKERVAICGCHGKTTATGLLAYCLEQLGKQPGYMVGVPEISQKYGGQAGKADYFIVEADEYGVDVPRDTTAKFLFLHPTTIIATNIDFDHPDVYNSLEETKQVFFEFFQNTIKNNRYAKIIACADNDALMEVIDQIPKENVQTYGFSEQADYRMNIINTAEAKTEFTLSHNGNLIGNFQVGLFGDKQVGNCGGVIAYLLLQGFSQESIGSAMIGFTGTKRRFELKFQKNSFYLFDDYAHHPTEIAATIQAARDRFPGYSIHVIFQPHTFSRTEQFADDFISALAKADSAFIFPVFASARETKTEDPEDSADLVVKAKQKGISTIISSQNEAILLKEIDRLNHSNCVLFTMGAGDIYHLSDGIIHHIQ